MRITAKNWVSTLINIIGMGVALATFMTIMVQVRWSWTYDKGYKDAGDIVRVEHSLIGKSWYTTFCRPVIELLKDCGPDILACGTDNGVSHDIIHRAETPDDQIRVAYVRADSAFFSVFSFEWTQGSPKDFTGPNATVISEATARQVFGDASPVGQTLINTYGYQYNIVAVYKDFPKNGMVPNGIINNIDTECIDDSNEWSYACHLRLTDISKAEQTRRMLLEKLLPLYADDGESPTEEEKAELESKVRFTCLHDAYFERDLSTSDIKGNKGITDTLFAIALLIIAIAIINFAFARIPFNIKSINTRKVIGASKGSLIATQLANSVLIAATAFLLAVALMKLASGTALSGIVQGSLKPSDNAFAVALTFAIAIVSAILAGLAPAVYSVSQPTAIVLKGVYAMTAKGKALRTALIALQFILSFVFIIFALFINVQTKFMQRQEMGFNDEQVLQVSQGQRAGRDRQAYTDRLLQNPSITAVTFSDRPLVEKGNKMGWSRGYNGQTVSLEVLPVSEDFLDFFGLEIVEGRNFSEADNNSENGLFIFNERAMQEYPDLHVGSLFSGHKDEDAEIVGVVKDFNYKPLQYAIAPFTFYLWGSEPWRSFGTSYVKVVAGCDYAAVMDYIRKTVAELDPDTTPEMVSVGFMVSAPAVYALIRSWRQNFAYQSPIPAWIFIAALALVVAVTFLVVTLQSYRAASANPVESLKNE